MKKVYFVHGEGGEEFIEKAKSCSYDVEAILYAMFLKKEIDSTSHVVVAASIPEMKEVFKRASVKGFSVSIIAQKSQSALRASFDIPTKFEEAMEIALEREPKAMDMLYANDEIVLWSALLGDAPPLNYKNSIYIDSSLSERLKRLKEAFKKFKDLKKTKIKLTTQKGQEINTVASGIVVIEHDTRSCASSLVKDSLSVSDGKLSALLVSPASIMDYMNFLYISLFKASKKITLPDSVGFVKSEALDVESEVPLTFAIDGQESADKKSVVRFEVRKQAVRFAASEKFWAGKKEDTSEKETLKLTGLPLTKEGIEYSQEKVPFFTHASEERYKDLFAGLRDQGRLESTFVTLMVLSTLLATVGLFLNSASVVIGAMLLAPLMQPIVSGSMGVLRSDQNLLLGSFKTVGIGVVLVLLTSSIIALILPFDNLTSEIAARLHPSLLDLIVALASGVAAAYAKNNEKIIGSLAGVSIAVALVPPIATAGIGLGWMQFDIFYQAFLLFVTNFVGIIFAAALTFLVLGYAPIKRAKKGLSYALVVAAIVAIPLYFSFKTMVIDSHIQSTLERKHYILGGKDVKIANVLLSHEDILVVKCELVVSDTLDKFDLSRLKSQLKESIDEKFVLEIVQRVKF